MKRFGVMGLLFLFLATVHAGVPVEPPYRLDLESLSQRVREGESIRLRLAVAGRGVLSVVQATPGIMHEKEEPRFVYDFEVLAVAPGIQTFGPYTLSINGHLLSSNRVVVNVLPKNQIEKLGTFFRVNKTNITLGDEILFTVETWDTSFRRNPIHFIKNDAFDVHPGDTSLESHPGPHGMVVHKKQVWVLIPHKAGDFRISRDLFDQFPDGIDPPNILIQVNPSSSGK